MRFAGSPHDALNRLAHLVAGPVERAERAIADGAVRTDEVARGQDARAPGLRRLRVAIEEPGKARRYRVGERARDAGALADVEIGRASCRERGWVSGGGGGLRRSRMETSDVVGRTRLVW